MRIGNMLSRLLVLSSSSSLVVRPAVAWLAGQNPRASSSLRLLESTCSNRLAPRASASSQLQVAAAPYSSSASPASSDDSAMSRSRAPFRMPKNSADDSVPAKKSGDNSRDASWNSLGLWTELIDSLSAMKLESPTPVQSLVIPTLLKAPKPPNVAFLAATGSGKTLAYCLPLLQQLKTTEVFGDDALERRKPKRPRLVIIAPTRELVAQIKDVVKQLCHYVKLSSVALVGGQDYGQQRKALDKPVDVVVSTPGRLLQHWKEGHVFFGDVQYVVMDEMDTLVEQGFQTELQDILYPLLWQKPLNEDNPIPKEMAPTIVLTSATMTQSVQKLVLDPMTLLQQKQKDNNDPSSAIHAKKHYTKPGVARPKMILPPVEIIKAPGLHKAVPRLEQVFVDVGNVDKISLLVDVVSSSNNKRIAGAPLTMVFCNTAASCRAVQFALAEARIDSLSYHGDLNSILRTENLKRFRAAGEHPEHTSEPRVLVCTDLAARGLDVPQVDHVVMFDFPLNALDYLHRSGRTARGIADPSTAGQGKVTALVTKRDKVLATAIETAVLKGEPLDGLSSRKSDYLPGGRLHKRKPNSERRPAGRGPNSQKQQRRSVHAKSGGGGRGGGGKIDGGRRR